MRYEMILSYTLDTDGRKIDAHNEGELIRCESCKHSNADNFLHRLLCRGKVVEPEDYCSKGGTMKFINSNTN